MECAFMKVGNHKPCQLKPTRNSNYCKVHNYLKKESKVLPCKNAERAPTQDIKSVQNVVLIK